MSCTIPILGISIFLPQFYSLSLSQFAFKSWCSVSIFSLHFLLFYVVFLAVFIYFYDSAGTYYAHDPSPTSLAQNTSSTLQLLRIWGLIKEAIGPQEGSNTQVYWAVLGQGCTGGEGPIRRKPSSYHLKGQGNPNKKKKKKRKIEESAHVFWWCHTSARWKLSGSELRKVAEVWGPICRDHVWPISVTDSRPMVFNWLLYLTIPNIKQISATQNFPDHIIFSWKTCYHYLFLMKWYHYSAS